MEILQEAFKIIVSMDKEFLEIIFVTLTMATISTIISSFLGITIGLILVKKSRLEKPSRFMRWFLKLNSMMMAFPPVVCGLFVFLLLSRNGPLGEYRLLFSIPAMVFAQVILITPVVISLTYDVARSVFKQMNETLIGLHLSKKEEFILLIKELKNELISIICVAFSRSLAEVGAVNMVGGNIQYKTRVLTTAIMLETSKGNFDKAIAMGLVLLTLAFVIQISIGKVLGKKYD
ncbi:MAG: ABC transporter permease [Anaerorhabdus sp.]